MRAAAAGLAAVSVIALAGCGGGDGSANAASATGGAESARAAQAAATVTPTALRPGDVRLCFEAALSRDNVTEVEPYGDAEERVAAGADHHGLGTMSLSFRGMEDEYGTRDAPPAHPTNGDLDAENPGNYSAAPIDLFFFNHPADARRGGNELNNAMLDKLGEVDLKDIDSVMQRYETRGTVLVEYESRHPADGQVELVDRCLADAGPAQEVGD